MIKYVLITIILSLAGNCELAECLIIAGESVQMEHWLSGGKRKAVNGETP